ncbi:MAG: hypothetical protein FJ265_09695 [Planctomycetes bacterium]|nr:hypothetical protein [Planctomycetota bacterium]
MHPLTPTCVLLLAATATAQWSLQATANTPTSRTEAAMTFDLARGRTVLFGGAAIGTPAGLRADTWLHDGSDWTLATPANSPAGRLGAGMAFDLARNVVVMFGGITSMISIALPTNQTWEWDGTDWTQAAPAASPTGRAYHAMAYDVLRQRVVVYGGSTNPGLLMTSNQTWEYDGTTWVQTALQSPGNPGARQYAGMAYHQALQRSVLFGGISPHTGGNNQTWLYDGTNWTLVAVPTAPPLRNLAKLVYDDARAVCLLQGGADPATGTPIDDTWEFDGAVWTQPATAQPTTRTRFSLAYDPIRRKAVLFGGIGPGNVARVDTWRYGAHVADLGPGCAGSNGVPALAGNGDPRIGATFSSSLTNLANGAVLAAVAAGLFANVPPLPLDPYGLPGCLLHTNVDALVFLPVLGGAMTSQFTIPQDPSLFGVSIHQQGLSLDPGVNAAGLAVSNAITMVIGW